jgi:hypothetical protein
MNEHNWLAEQFEENRSHLKAVAYRMLGSPGSMKSGSAAMASASTRTPRLRRKSMH